MSLRDPLRAPDLIEASCKSLDRNYCGNRSLTNAFSTSSERGGPDGERSTRRSISVRVAGHGDEFGHGCLARRKKQMAAIMRAYIKADEINRDD